MHNQIWMIVKKLCIFQIQKAIYGICEIKFAANPVCETSLIYPSEFELLNCVIFLRYSCSDDLQYCT